MWHRDKWECHSPPSFNIAVDVFLSVCVFQGLFCLMTYKVNEAPSSPDESRQNYFQLEHKASSDSHKHLGCRDEVCNPGACRGFTTPMKHPNNVQKAIITLN